MTSSGSDFYRYWGKARPESAEGDRYHLLPYHALDVAACGQVLLGLPRFSMQPLADALGWSREVVNRLLVYFLALHDVGKFSRGFQNLAPNLSPSLVSAARIRAVHHQRHDTLGWLLWRRVLSTGSTPLVPAPASEFWRVWARTAMGHHGEPPHELQAGGQFPLEAEDHFLPADCDAAVAFAHAVGQLLLPAEIPAPTSIQSAVLCRFSWNLAGIAVLADWIGSDQLRFRYRSTVMSLDEYWRDTALPIAASAVAGAGLSGATVRKWEPPEELLSGIQELSPLQRYAAEVSLETGPQLFILEDVTGAGKTEAALLLAQRLMSMGLAHGFYFALPTMATATQMYDRVGKLYRRMFTSDSRPSLVLAHSAREMVDGFRDSIVIAPGAPPASSRNDPGFDTAAECAAWLADSRKKALLAEVGVGTIDQALLAVMPVRHQSLRMLGLLGKVLIVDEVHSYDSYMHELLKVLLEHHARGGGSVLLLSATIPQVIRVDLLAAYSKGRGKAIADAVTSDLRYPLATQCGGELRSHACATREPLKRTARVVMIHDEAEIVRLIASEATTGRCVGWIRNTVEDARRGYQEVSECCASAGVALFHSRFALGDRLDIERRVTARFGKESNGVERRGQIVVGTQVMEQSLDYDVDVLVSDWAPIELIIQRAGRLMRHPRNVNGDLAKDGRDQRGEAVLYVLVPEFTMTPAVNWYSELFPKGKYVYPDTGRLWLGAEALRTAGTILTPGEPGGVGGVRSLVEAVYGEEASEIPEALQTSSVAKDGRDLAEQSQARFNALRLDRGYAIDSSMHWDEDDQVPTRLGDETRMVYLAVEHEGDLHPLRGDLPRSWEASAVRADARRFRELGAEWKSRFGAAVERLRDSTPLLREPALILPLIPDADGGLYGFVSQSKGPELKVWYDQIQGLRW